MELKTITPSIRRLGGIYTFEVAGEEMPKQPPAIINPGDIKRATRARGEDSAIPVVEIYTDDQGAAGQEAAPERRVAKAQREAKKRLSSRKEVMAAEKEILEQKVAQKVSKEKVSKEIVGGVERKVITEPMLEDKLTTKKEIAELKLRKAEAKAKKAVADAFTEGVRAQTYLQFANERARELQGEKGIKWKEAKEIATTEWKEKNKSKISGMLTDVESDKPKKSKSSSSEKIPKPDVIKAPKGFVKVKRADGTIDIIETKASKDAKLAEEKKKADEMKLKPSAPAKEKREKEMTQRKIIEFVSALNNDEVETEYRTRHPRKALPSLTVMRNDIIKSLGGRASGGKYKYGTSDESS